MIKGHFNALLQVGEKCGGRRVGNSNDATFRGFMDYIGGIELEFCRNQFTWDNDRVSGNMIKERIGKAICNSMWRIKFLGDVSSHIPCSISDHSVVLLDLFYDKDFKTHPFRFISTWFRHST